MIVVTGAAGFIGSCLVSKLNQAGREDLLLVDDFSILEKQENLHQKHYHQKIERSVFLAWLKENHKSIHFIFHLGARTDTTLFDTQIFDALNLNYSKEIWKSCADFSIPLVYASSAATYGLGEFGYEDNHEIIEKLKPLNPYGDSKNDFDKWAVKQNQAPPFWAGLKFFNVYGPNEYHKGRMASVIFHAFHQIQQTGAMKLFRSHHSDYKDGGQLRDFVYVKDVVQVCLFLLNHQSHSGIYNLGTGQARSFYDLTKNTFQALNKEIAIEYIDTPLDIRDKYQYFTEAKMDKLKAIGYNSPFFSLEEGVKDYVQNFLVGKKYF